MAILQQGQQYQGGTVQYDSATGKRLGTNEITVENKDLTANGQYPDMAKFNIPQANSAITTSSLAPAQPFVPAITQPYTAPIVAPLTAPKLDLTTQEQGALDQVSPYQQLIDQLSGSTSELAQKSFRKQQSESMGLNAANNLSQSLYDKSQSLDLRSQAIQAQKQADIQGLQNTAQQGGANVTKGGLAPQQRAIETRTNQQELSNTLDKLDNAVSYYASIGQVRQAQQKVDQAIDTEFTPKLLALDTAQRNLASLLKSPNLTAAQEKLALNRQAELTAQQDAIKEAAQLKKDTGDARIKALTNNPNMPQQQHDAISLAQSPEEVAQLVNYFGLSSISKSDQLDQTYKQAQIDKAQYDLAHPQKHTQVIEANNGHTILIDTDTGATVKDYGAKAAPTGGGASGSTTVSLNGTPTAVNSDALSYAQQYASTGKLPSPAELKLSGLNVADVTAIAKGLPKQNGAIIDNNTGVKSSSLSSAQEDAITAMNEIVTQTMPMLKDRFGKINTGVLGGIGGAIWTSQDRQDYDTFRKEFLSKLLVARSGAAVTEQEYARYADMLPSNFNQAFFLGSDGSKKLNALDTSMKTNLDNKLNALQVNVAGYSDVKKQLEQLSPEQKAELEKEGLIPAWAK